jgi:hypothetical protein
VDDYVIKEKQRQDSRYRISLKTLGKSESTNNLAKKVADKGLNKKNIKNTFVKDWKKIDNFLIVAFVSRDLEERAMQSDDSRGGRSRSEVQQIHY